MYSYEDRSRAALRSLQIVIVSRYGVFVVEAKNFQGWIFGDEKQAEWTQALPGEKIQVTEMELGQNWRHRALTAATGGLVSGSMIKYVLR